MALTPRLDMRQSQSLVMTPQLMQAIQLLQMSNLDLVAYVQQELESNPLLESVSDDYSGDSGSSDNNGQGTNDAQGADQANSANSDSSDGTNSEGAGDSAPDPDLSDQFSGESPEQMDAISNDLDARLDNVFPDDSGPQEQAGPSLNDPWMSAPMRDGGGNPDYDLETVLAGEISLADHLEQQLMTAIADERKRIIGQFLINELDEFGYLQTDLAMVANRLGVDEAEVSGVLDILQSFEPSGVFARSLSECLAIQLKDLNRYDPAIAVLLDNLELLAKRDFVALRKLCAVDEEDLSDMISEIKALNPRPGSAFGHLTVQPVVPDVFVRQASDGGWRLELNSETLPRVLVNRTYYAQINETAAGKKEKEFLIDCLQSANWLVKSLDQRAQTILKVATEIVKQQDAFFAYGVTHLKPLNLRTIADAIQMHESTVSRVTSNKYIATNRGTFEMKYFFTSAISATSGGDSHSAEAVKHRIRQAIDGEAADSILSDDALVKLLRESGIDIARRTVAKYREAMHIPSSVQRRREKKAARG
ncbi:RNA polymerase, sigma 54 subunit, RpoN/SigL [Cohaesibacter marisflavi]|uniref:RNA polymerase sigma-54 factor n=1 Tax=Cohaesibacter marisflavi TaxID=655353 RepID=A0A1I5CW90_9HYPH|nr:RNA polymerase factor sigma-54 [Cohaesibacter marisflavi]SFN91203.1 RNA polymerase, sigma 54 subunit, RpoN/SigL [Cohaesibacter marisflavi]